MLLDHRVTVTFKADPPLLAVLRDWVAKMGGMTDAEAKEVTERLRGEVDRLRGLSKEPPSTT